MGRPIIAHHPADRADEEDQIIARLRAGERVEHFDTVRLRSDGRPVHVSLTISPVRDEAGRIVGASKIARDITERKRAERPCGRASGGSGRSPATRRSGIFQTDAEGELPVRQRAVVRDGRPVAASEARGQGWVNALHPDDRDRVAGVVRGGERGAGVRRRVPLPNTPRAKSPGCPAVPSALRDEGGQVTGYIGTVTDITERKRAEQALQEADRRKDEFLATLAHELRNPLAPIRNGLQLMRLARTTPRHVAEQARSMMERQVGQMVRLIDDLLDVSPHHPGQARAPPGAGRPGGGGQRVPSRATRPLIEAAGHELTVALPPEPVYLDADPTRLAQVFANLLNNAAKYTERGGHIWLTRRAAGRRGRRLGRGTPASASPPSTLPRLFEMFTQVDPALERSQGGLGIGLSLVKGLVEMHGGQRRGPQRRPGQGQRVRRPPAGRGRVGRRGAARRRRSGSEPRRGPSAASWWWTTTGTRPTAWR